MLQALGVGTYIVLVDFSDHFIEMDITKAEIFTSLREFIDGDVTAPVFVKEGESIYQVLLSLQLVHVHRCSKEFTVIYAAVVVYISLSDPVHPIHCHV